MTIRCHFDGKVFVPDEPVNVPVNQPLTLHLNDAGPPANNNSMTGERLANSSLVGIWADRSDIGDSVEFARELRRRAEQRGGGQ